MRTLLQQNILEANRMRPALVGALITAALFAFGCGGRGGQGDRGPSSSASPNDAGSVLADGGNNTAQDGGVGPVFTDGGTQQPDGGSGNGGLSACAGFTPSVPQSPQGYAEQVGGPGGLHSCLVGAGDGDGNLLLVTGEEEGNGGFYVSRTGTLLGHEGAPFDPIGQTSTFEGIVSASAQSWVEAFDESGNEVAAFPSVSSGWPRPVAQANDPLGGIVVVMQPYQGSPTLYAFDERLNVRWTAALSFSGNVLALGVDRQGQTLILFDGASMFGGSALGGQWFDHHGGAGAVFDAWASAPKASFELYEQVGSGLFLRDKSGADPWVWARSFVSGATQSAAAPPWLTSRPSTSLHMAYGGQAYALLPDPGASSSPTCAQSIEIVAPDGESCGSATFAAGAQACQTSFLRVGYDGTVIQTVPNELLSCSLANPGDCYCKWQWWPAFFGAAH